MNRHRCQTQIEPPRAARCFFYFRLILSTRLAILSTVANGRQRVPTDHPRLNLNQRFDNL